MNRTKIKMNKFTELTLRDGCNKYIDNCKQRNLREHTIKHYQQSYLKLFTFFDEDMSLNDFTKESYNEYVIFLKDTLTNDISINAYLRDLITTIHFLQKEGYVDQFKMQSIKVDKHTIETYTDKELGLLLKKPDIKKCSFVEYQCWVICNFLLSTGVRQRSLMNIKVKDIDFDNNLVSLSHTKNRKTLLIPLNSSMILILHEFLKYRKPKNNEDYLFCNTFGQQLTKSTSYHMLYFYNKSRGVEKTGLHRWRHTFAKQWILSGGNVVTLSRLLGHSSLDITQNYLNLLISDLAKEVDEIDLLGKYSERKSIKLK